MARGRARPRHSQQTRPQVRSGTTIRAQRDAMAELRAARIDVRCEKDWLCSMKCGQRLLITAKHVEALTTSHARWPGRSSSPSWPPASRRCSSAACGCLPIARRGWAFGRATFALCRTRRSATASRRRSTTWRVCSSTSSCTLWPRSLRAPSLSCSCARTSPTANGWQSSEAIRGNQRPSSEAIRGQ